VPILCSSTSAVFERVEHLRLGEKLARNKLLHSTFSTWSLNTYSLCDVVLLFVSARLLTREIMPKNEVSTSHRFSMDSNSAIFRSKSHSSRLAFQSSRLKYAVY